LPASPADPACRAALAGKQQTLRSLTARPTLTQYLTSQDPADSSHTVGSIVLTIQSTTLQNLEHQFWGRVLGIADLNGDGELSLEEFVMLMQASPGLGRAAPQASACRQTLFAVVDA